MRVLGASADAARSPYAAARSLRVVNLEALALGACAVVVALGLMATTWGRLRELAIDDRGARTIDVRRIASPEPLLPLLPMFGDPVERQAAARAIYRRATNPSTPLTHVGALADVSITASEIRANRRYGRLASRLERSPSAASARVLTSSDLAALKPSLTVRSQAEYVSAIRLACVWFFGAFLVAHAFRRVSGADDDPLLLPIVLLLTGLGLMSMIALRDPLRDTVAATTFVQGVVVGIALLVAVSEIDFEASPLRRAVGTPLALALVLATFLLVLGSGPGSSGVKVNLFGAQPVEIIRLLIVFSLAAYLARRSELIRELSERVSGAPAWLHGVRVPRWRDVRPIVVSMTLVLAFFFLQKDLGPALVIAAVVTTLYAIARGRAGAIALGIAMLATGFAAAYWIGYPATVWQRVHIWADPWNNGVPGGNQIAHGLWAMATGALTGSGPGRGSAASVPAAHTDFVLAAIGEQLGLAGVTVVFAMYALLAWRCLRVARRAPGDYTAFLVTGLSLALVLQAALIAAGILGLFPLSGVVTPFLSYGRSSMIANCVALGVVLAVARRAGPVRRHLDAPLRVVEAALAVILVVVVARAAWVQGVKADAIATASSLTEQADGGFRFEYNPRLVAAARLLERGSIYDRNGLPLATSRSSEISRVRDLYRQAGVAGAAGCDESSGRCYPLGGEAFHLLGDWSHQTNWGARNASYIERDSDATLKGFDDRQQIVEVTNPRTGERVPAVRRDYRDLLPIARKGLDTTDPVVAAILSRPRDVRSSIDARLQVRVASALRERIVEGRFARGAAVVLDAGTGEVLASVSYPWPSIDSSTEAVAGRARGTSDDDLLDRTRYGLYPPGSTFKLLVAAAALKSQPSERDDTFECVRLPDGRVGNYLKGWKRPVRDDPMDTHAHGRLDLRGALVVSCNAYFAQLAQRLGPGPVMDAAGFFQIETSRPATAAALRGTLPLAGYGQGHVLASPLKMARVAAAIADGGRVQSLKWTPSIGAPAGDAPRFLSEADASLLAKYMRDVVTNGTGRTVAGSALPIAGKTGTAEVDGGRAHSWFAGFAPYDGAHRLAFAVIVENAGYGARAAAPVAADIVRAAAELGLMKDSTGGTR